MACDQQDNAAARVFASAVQYAQAPPQPRCPSPALPACGSFLPTWLAAQDAAPSQPLVRQPGCPVVPVTKMPRVHVGNRSASHDGLPLGNLGINLIELILLDPRSLFPSTGSQRRGVLYQRRLLSWRTWRTWRTWRHRHHRPPLFSELSLLPYLLFSSRRHAYHPLRRNSR